LSGSKRTVKKNTQASVVASKEIGVEENEVLFMEKSSAGSNQGNAYWPYGAESFVF
jgi:hypothetical protein